MDITNQFNMEDSNQIAKTQFPKQQFDEQSKLQRSISYMESQPPSNKKNNFQYDTSNSNNNKLHKPHVKPLSESSQEQEEPIKYKNQKLNKEMTLDQQEVQTNLREIFNYYSQSYLQPTKKYETFDVVKNRYIKFQSFVLFLKDFSILKTIFSLTKIKILFKKYAKYGKHMDFQNFFEVVNAMPHQNETKQVFNNVFNIEKYTNQLKTLDSQVTAELQKHTFFNFMKLLKPKEYRKCFSKIFQPFNCQEEAELPKIKYNYRKFSYDQLHKKAIPDPKNQRQKQKKREFIVLKSKEKPVESSILNEAKPMIVSWELFRSKSLGNIQRSFEKVRRKIIHESEQDDIYLQKFRLHNGKKLIRNISQSPTKQVSRINTIQKKIMQIQLMQQKKDQQILDRIDNKMKKRKQVI